jgi:hypothetical protein
LEFTLARLGEDGNPAAGIVRMRPGSDKALLLQTAEHAAHQTGIEPEIVADFGHVGAAHADRVQNACGAERPAPAKEGRVQRTDFHGDGASETTKPAYTIVRHNV